MSNNDLVQAWIAKAESDLGTARLIMDNGCMYPDQVCFHCQQCIEKLMKSHLVKIGIEPSRTHSLILLLNDLKKSGYTVDDHLYALAAGLEEYSVGVRYPQGNYEVEPADAQDAYNTAIELVVLLDRLSLNKQDELENSDEDEFELE